jgi:hypothetical protein
MPERPYEIIGAGHLVSSVWKRGSEEHGWSYRFNVFRVDVQSGIVSRLFRPADLPDLLQLCRLLAAELASDGCLVASDRRRLAVITDVLDSLLDEIAASTPNMQSAVRKSSPSVSKP